jgi:hypothetical protein
MSKEEFYITPQGYTGPPHLTTLQISSCALLTFILLCASQKLPFLIYVSFVPLLAAFIGRKDKGVFYYGCWIGLAQLITQLFSGVPFSIIILLLPLFSGLWTWLSRKLYYYLAFPDVTTTLADAPRRTLVLNWPKQLLLCFSGATLWCYFEWFLSEILKSPWSQLGISYNYPTISFFGNLPFFIIFINMTIATSLEYKLLLPQSKWNWQLPLFSLLLFLGGNLLCHYWRTEQQMVYHFDVGILTAKTSQKQIKQADLFILPFLQDNSTKFSPPLLSIKKNYKLAEITRGNEKVFAYRKIHTSNNAGQQYRTLRFQDHVRLSINLGSDIIHSNTTRQFIRNGANVIIVLAKNPEILKRHCQSRSLENGVPVLLCSAKTTYLFMPDQTMTKFSKSTLIKIPLTDPIEPTFFYRQSKLQTHVISLLTFLIFLIMGVHFINRKKTLYDLRQ